MDNYLYRLIDKRIYEAMQYVGGIVIQGPKWCGKSTTAKKYANTIVELQRSNVFNTYKIYSDTGDDNLFKGTKPIMYDEWQKIPEIWDYVRAEIDNNSGGGQFILTGSSKPIEDKNRHSGIGRIKRFVMRPMSLWESLESSGEVSLKQLFDPDYSISGNQKQSVSEMAYILCRGGWPESVVKNESSYSLNRVQDYVSTLIDTDITEMDDIRRNPTRAFSVLKSYARNISSSTPYATIQRDVVINDTSIDIRTLDSYINAYKKLYIFEDVEAWSPRLRSKAVLRTTNTRQFCDPSIAAAVLDASPEDLLNDLNTYGLMFESMCIRDLRVYAESISGKVFNYRDSQGLEADAIIHLRNGKWGAIEVKLGGTESIENAAKQLLKLKDKVDIDKMNEPSFLMVLTASKYAYKRKDGIIVVPIGCLKD